MPKTTKNTVYSNSQSEFAAHVFTEMQYSLDSEEPKPHGWIKTVSVSRIGVADKQRMNNLHPRTEAGYHKPLQPIRYMRTLADNSEAPIWHAEFTLYTTLKRLDAIADNILEDIWTQILSGRLSRSE